MNTTELFYKDLTTFSKRDLITLAKYYNIPVNGDYVKQIAKKQFLLLRKGNMFGTEQQQLLIQKQELTQLQKFLSEIIQSQYLEDAYFIFVKNLDRKNWQQLQELFDKNTIFYWYAYTFSGGNKMYNIVWGTFSNGVAKITSGCSYYFNTKAHLQILNNVIDRKKQKGYVYLGGTVRDRFSETMKEYRPDVFTAKEKNRVDLDKELTEFIKINNLDTNFVNDMLSNISKKIETSNISNKRIPADCAPIEECANDNDYEEKCQLYYYGNACYKEKEDYDYVECEKDLL